MEFGLRRGVNVALDLLKGHSEKKISKGRYKKQEHVKREDKKKDVNNSLFGNENAFIISLVVSVIISIYTSRWSRGFIYYITFYLLYLCLYNILAQKYKILRCTDSIQAQYLSAGVLGWIIGVYIVYYNNPNVKKGW